jgi:hypothetical protein
MQTDNKLCRWLFLNGKTNSLKNNIHRALGDTKLLFITFLTLCRKLTASNAIKPKVSNTKWYKWYEI